MLCFRGDPYLTKPEVSQYLEKLYGIEVEQMNTFVHKGKVIRDMSSNKKFKKHDFKKFMVKTTFKVQPEFQAIDT